MARKRLFYHIKNLQSTKTQNRGKLVRQRFYHIKNLQSTKTYGGALFLAFRFITLRIYKVLKHQACKGERHIVLSH